MDVRIGAVAHERGTLPVPVRTEAMHAPVLPSLRRHVRTARDAAGGAQSGLRSGDAGYKAQIRHPDTAWRHPARKHRWRNREIVRIAEGEQRTTRPRSLGLVRIRSAA